MHQETSRGVRYRRCALHVVFDFVNFFEIAFFWTQFFVLELDVCCFLCYNELSKNVNTCVWW